eukprot:3336968-Pleurochrysis_carterae.AAC.2
MIESEAKGLHVPFQELRHRIDEPTTPPAEPSTPAPTPTPTTTSTPRTSPTPTPPCVASSSPASPTASSPSPVGSGTGGLARIGGRKAQPTQGEVTGARPKTRSKARTLKKRTNNCTWSVGPVVW